MGRLIVVVVCLSGLILTGCPMGPVLAPNVDREVNQIYGQGYVTSGDSYELADLYFDVLAPNDDPSPDKPAVLMVHGGGFEGGSRKDNELVIVANNLAKNGYVCFLIDYRIKDDNPPPADQWKPYIDQALDEIFGDNLGFILRLLLQDFLPTNDLVHAATVDTRTALRYMVANAETYGIDPNRIAVWGESAGAISVLNAAINDTNEFDSDGDDFPVPEENNPDEIVAIQAIVDCWGTALYVQDQFDANDPPIMIWHGDADTRVPYPLATDLVNQCVAANIAYRLYTAEGEDHGAWEAVIDGVTLSEATLDFLAEHLP